MKVMYKNKNTGDLVSVEKTEVLEKYLDPIIVYILSDGSRWNADMFFDEHEKVNESLGD